MKNILGKVMLSISYLMIFFSHEKMFGVLNAALGECDVTGGTVVAAWLVEDSGVTKIQGSIGTTDTDPSTWTITDISDDITGATQFFDPHVFANDNGDVVVLYQYVDGSSNYQVAASMLPSAATTWNTDTISDTGQTAGFFDELASIDETGNIFAVWTVYDSTAGVNRVMGATAVIGTTTNWEAATPVSQ